MDVEKVIAALEKYLREFIVYLVTFFRPTVTEEIYDDHENYNKSVIFAIFSTAMGAFMWSRYILHEPNSAKDIFGLMVDNLLKWVSFGILLFVIVRLFRRSIPIVRTVIAVVKVFSVAHVIAIYLAYLAINFFWLWSEPACREVAEVSVGTITTYLIEMLFIWIYLPREVVVLAGATAGRTNRIAINAMFLGILSLVIVVLCAVSMRGYYDKQIAANIHCQIKV
ncbi:hypothetical protein [Novosphingobium sp.]|uniref:hypothetical protein n=1 Tax=Novosphingobium sp. TaxID=1874826 RepID=UPI00286D3EAF|nr:hypothetical protein [Novosphingobium sp.]